MATKDWRDRSDRQDSQGVRQRLAHLTGRHCETERAILELTICNARYIRMTSYQGGERKETPMKLSLPSLMWLELDDGSTKSSLLGRNPGRKMPLKREVLSRLWMTLSQGEVTTANTTSPWGFMSWYHVESLSGYKKAIFCGFPKHG